MKYLTNCFRLLLIVPFLTLFFFKRGYHEPPQDLTANFVKNNLINGQQTAEEEETEETRSDAFSRKRIQHELDMLRNPVTGTIPANVHEMELKVASSIPSKIRSADLSHLRIFGAEELQNLNPYQSIGPNNIGGRSRTLAFDRRNVAIMLTGGVTGGIFRSSDAGVNWTFVSPENEIRSVTSIVQDPINANSWYCGTGEAYTPNSQQEIARPGTVGHGIFKSTDNGISWAKLTATADNDPNNFNGFFDLVHRMAVSPTNSNVFAAIHNRIVRSRDGGMSWQTVLVSGAANNSLTGMTEVLINPNGSKIFAAFSGANADRGVAGVWESATGDSASWRRIAGGLPGQPDSIAGWLPHTKYERIVLGLSPQNKLYVLYKNDKDASGTNPLPEADLFQCDISTNNPATYAWANLNAYVPNEPGGKIAGINPYTTQFSGFNMSIAVKPDNENILFIGGTSLWRVDLAQTNPASKFRRAGGYARGFIPNNFIYPNHHPDIHGIYFSPTNSNSMFTASDGGIHRTSNASLLEDTIRWTSLNNGLQTLQYEFINIFPETSFDFIIGGAQDNGTLANLNAPTFLDHAQLGGGDGASAAMSGFYKTGNTWKQYWYFSVINGYISRSDFTWLFDPATNNINLTSNTFTDISPTGMDTSGQYLTLFINDMDSTDHIYYNNRNKVFRTTRASTVTPTTWTELTGIAATVPAADDLTAMAVSKKTRGNKFLFFATDAGKVYRLNNPHNTAANTTPTTITPPTMTANSYVSGIGVNPRNPDTVMVVVSNYDAASGTVNNVFWSGNATTAAPTWQVIEGALGPLSAQSCAIVIKTSGVEYYVGTSVGLYSATTITGNTTAWVNEGNGMMKRAIVRSLVNRQLDNTLVVGTHGNGAFLSKIGSAVVLPPDLTTGVDVVRNDRNFIRTVFPTLATNNINFKTGSLVGITGINCRVMAVTGQLLYETNVSYTDGTIPLNQLPSGSYVLVITSSNNKYQSVTRFNKN
ncbi:MAG: hypothetical protein WKF89_00270 [Chitinophagaceae bacterium]